MLLFLFFVVAEAWLKFFFFFQAEDGIRDGTVTWSSDVCSSDLDHGNEVGDDVERRDHVDERQHEQCLGEHRHPPVAEEPPVEPREVRQVNEHLEKSPGEKVAWKRRDRQRHCAWMTCPC